MTDPIRWDDPASLELFNTVTGETAPVVWFAWCAPKGCYEVTGEPRNAACYYRADGNPQYSTYPNWIIRNKPPHPCCDAAKELADLRERVSNAFKTVKAYLDEGGTKDTTGIGADGNYVRFSDFTQPEPVKVDPLLIEARKMLAEDHQNGRFDFFHQGVMMKSGAGRDAIMAGVFDNNFYLSRYLQALKRGLTITEGEAK